MTTMNYFVHRFRLPSNVLEMLGWVLTNNNSYYAPLYDTLIQDTIWVQQSNPSKVLQIVVQNSLSEKAAQAQLTRYLNSGKIPLKEQIVSNPQGLEYANKDRCCEAFSRHNVSVTITSVGTTEVAVNNEKNVLVTLFNIPEIKFAKQNAFAVQPQSIFLGGNAQLIFPVKQAATWFILQYEGLECRIFRKVNNLYVNPLENGQLNFTLYAFHGIEPIYKSYVVSLDVHLII